MGMTPKPWEYGVRRDGSKWLSLGDPKVGQHRQGDLCATIEDANLICAAPDLLGVLEVAVDHIALMYSGIAGGNVEAGQNFAAKDPVVQSMRKAISKAKGEDCEQA